MKNVIIAVSVFIIATCGAYIYHDYNRPQEQCVEDLVNVVCQQIESGNVNCDPIGEYQFKIPYHVLDSTRLYWVSNYGESGGWLDLNHISHYTDSGIYNLKISNDSTRFLKHNIIKYIKGKVSLFQTSDIDGIHLSPKNQFKIRAAINKHREIQSSNMEKEQLQHEKENIQRACDIVKKLN